MWMMACSPGNKTLVVNFCVESDVDFDHTLFLHLDFRLEKMILQLIV